MPPASAAAKNKQRKQRAKASKATQRAAPRADVGGKSEAPAVEVEYVAAALPASDVDGELAQVFERFSTPEELTQAQAAEEDEGKGASKAEATPAATEEEKEMSKKQKRKLKRLTIAELKQLVSRPEVVEQWDVTALDPRLLVHLKSYRNSIPVPRHWSNKRKFLSGARGVEKPPFQLPEFIAATGIEKIRATVMEKEQGKKLKSKSKERVQPKMGKIDIDYQVLHDAFFKWQTKPRMTLHGDLYYEGKEFEIRLKEKKPGDLSDDLRTSLGMPVGPNAHKVGAILSKLSRTAPPPLRHASGESWKIMYIFFFFRKIIVYLSIGERGFVGR